MEYKKQNLKSDIKSCINLLGSICFGINMKEFKEPKFLENGQTYCFYQELIRLVDKGKLNQAENMLYQKIDNYSKEYLELGLAFYCYMNEKEDEYLEQYDFSRKEILDGIHMFIKEFSIYEFDGILEYILET